VLDDAEDVDAAN